MFSPLRKTLPVQVFFFVFFFFIKHAYTVLCNLCNLISYKPIIFLEDKAFTEKQLSYVFSPGVVGEVKKTKSVVS